MRSMLYNSLLGSLQTEVDALKRLQAETAGRQTLHAPLDALLPAILDCAVKGEP